VNENVPIVLFVYNRPSHTHQTLEALAANYLADVSDLIVYSDGPKRPADQAQIDQVRQVVRDLKGFKSVTLIERTQNMGLAKSIISGVTEQIEKYGRVIVLEDDLVTSPYFLKYMNDALILYESDERVISIHGYCYPVAHGSPHPFFLKGTDCWGWATWKRGWAYFEPDSKKLYDQLKNTKQLKSFDYDGTAAFSKMLLDHQKGKVNSWAIRWHAAAYLAEKLTLFPAQSLVYNIGNDDSGTHSIKMDLFDVHVSNQPVSFEGVCVENSESMRRAFKQFFKKQKGTIASRVKARLLSIYFKFK